MTGIGDVRTHVIILAQGDQKRLLGTVEPKQLLPLPLIVCKDPQQRVTILERTLAQLRRWVPTARVTIVAGKAIVDHLKPQSKRGWHGWNAGYLTVWNEDLQMLTLRSPGNSSLKGLAQILDLREKAQASPVFGIAGWPRTHERTVVLLGDVVYSSACIQELLYGHFGESDERHQCAIPSDEAPWMFVGTRDLSASRGELWGISWYETEWNGLLRSSLVAALADHPPFETYQPGQLRRWLWKLLNATVPMDPPLARIPNYTAIDDYTMDVDLPSHIPLLSDVSELAAKDDKECGLTW